MVVEAIARQLVFIDQVELHHGSGQYPHGPRQSGALVQLLSAIGLDRQARPIVDPIPASERNDMNIVGALESPDLLL